MRSLNKLSTSFALLFAIFLSVAIISGCSDQGNQPTTTTQGEITLSKANPQIQATMNVQNKHTAELMKNVDVVGTATGLTEDGKPAIIVYTARALGPKVLPATLDGVPVIENVSGRIYALQAYTPIKVGNPGGGGGKPGGGTSYDPKARWRPVSIGISTGNGNECSAGTIGFRVMDTHENVYILSNNHVLALENFGQIGSDKIVQPGVYENAPPCIYNNSANLVGTLYDFETISFTQSNTMDAAIAKVDAGITFKNSTLPNGYGTPSSTTTTASLKLSVQKYGRTTGLTKGKVTGLNASVNVSYTNGVASFTGQIVISGTKGSFSKAGDSGSGIVTNDANKNPVGLLFAGSNTVTIANPIAPILTRFGVTIQ